MRGAAALRVTVAAQDEVEATLVALQMVATIGDGDAVGHRTSYGRPGCVMPTRARILYATF
jgi:hypothetical protein